MNRAGADFVKGARCYSLSEPELGIGIIIQIDAGVAVLNFPRAKLHRRYSLKSAPLKRALLTQGQKARLQNGTEREVTEIRFVEGLAQYFLENDWLWEHELSTEQLDLGALEQFLSGYWTPNEAFWLRRGAWELKAKASNPLTRGLVGSRVSLLPHQLFIASSVVSKLNPRVLLADEVGLGKTIEAGLIISSLHRLGRAGRILIVVPEALKTQWLAELFRRFQLLFSILDEARCVEEEKTNPSLTPFESNSLVICTVEHLMKFPTRLKQAIAAQWELVIFDEAHHLVWDPSDPSPAWITAKSLSESTKSLLLLTATPRQHGLDTQFGLLNLVDPERFSNFEKFKNEAAHLSELSAFAREFVENPEKPQLERLKKLFPEDEELSEEIARFNSDKNISALLGALIDRHGPGRVLFRNRRERLKGFPERNLLAHFIAGDKKFGTFNADYSRAHPKLKWLEKFLTENKNEKILLITSTAAQVKQIDQFLLDRVTTKKALFHDEMEMVERDRQAAWFADPKGAQVLIASEIGGEGRNFQFCKKIILFNLPPQTDLVEQRIGRLDRIGQKNNIEVIVPIIEGSEEELYFFLFNEGLGLFTRASAGLGALLENFQDDIEQIKKKILEASKTLSIKDESKALLKKIKSAVEAYFEEQSRNFDYLVDFNSFDETRGQQLKNHIQEIDAQSSLTEYMSRVFEFFGIEEDDLTHNIKKITAHSLMFVESFPELDDEKSITYSRNTALVREEIDFITQDHPMVSGVLSLILEKNLGQAIISKAVVPGVSSGALFEFIFVLNPPNVSGLTLEQFMRPVVLSCLLDHSGKKMDPKILHALRHIKLSTEEESSLRNSLGQLRRILPPLLSKAQSNIEPEVGRLHQKALVIAQDFFETERNRMSYLARINQSISKMERAAFENYAAQTLSALPKSQVQLDAIRMILCESD